MSGTSRRADVIMTAGEIREFLEQGRTMTLATVGQDGIPHLVAMWYAFVDGVPYFKTRRKSQKVLNLTRDPRASCLLEAGESYETLRGVSLEGSVIEVDDATLRWRVGVSLYERYTGPYVGPNARAEVERRLARRSVFYLDARRIRSWDHRKLS
jgi:PPOX class probable F420-dependent enzyme